MAVALAKEMNISIVKAKHIVSFIFDMIMNEVLKGKEVSISGFGSFKMQEDGKSVGFLSLRK